MMNRRTLALVLALTVVCAASSQMVFAADNTESEAHKGINAKEAVFESAALTDNPEAMKKVAKALAKNKGVLSAKIDDKDHALHVVFDPKLAKAEDIDGALAPVLNDFKRTALKDTTFVKHNCGKCPSASKCGKAKTASADKKD